MEGQSISKFGRPALVQVGRFPKRV